MEIPAGQPSITAPIAMRDNQDKTRKENPLIPAEDAIIIDTTNLGIEESLALILENIKK